MKPLRFVLLVLVCIGAMLANSLMAASPRHENTRTEKSKVQKAPQTAVMQEQVFTVEGMLMGQIPICARDAFEGFIVLPEAPARKIFHVPI